MPTGSARGPPDRLFEKRFIGIYNPCLFENVDALQSLLRQPLPSGGVLQEGQQSRSQFGWRGENTPSAFLKHLTCASVRCRYNGRATRQRFDVRDTKAFVCTGQAENPGTAVKISQGLLVGGRKPDNAWSLHVPLCHHPKFGVGQGRSYLRLKEFQ